MFLFFSLCLRFMLKPLEKLYLHTEVGINPQWIFERTFFLADLEGEVTFYSVLINYLKVLSTDFLCITPTFWSFENASSLHIMALRVVGFLSWGYKIRNIFPKNQHTQRKLLYFENWVNGGGVKNWASF